jgi:hypothetical protein
MKRVAVTATLGAAAFALAACTASAPPPAAQSAPAPAAFKRTADGKPDLNGIWQALVPANWDIRPHEARPAPLDILGALGAEPPNPGIVEGGEIPYLPAAAEQQKQNYANRFELDPERKCYMPGIPRATYLPQPFQIFQSGDNVAMAYQFANAVRTIYMKDPGPAPTSFWMGWSVGHWEGDTLVIEVTSQMPDTWLDRAGNFHSDELRVTERYTPKGENHLLYEATLEDPKVYSRPWKISFPLYRRIETNAEMLEFKCVPFAEEILYGHLRKGYKGDRAPAE